MKDLFAADSLSRMYLMLGTCVAEIRKHTEEIKVLRGSLSAQESTSRFEALKDLLMDGARKAESTRDKDP